MDFKKEAEDLIKMHYAIIFNQDCDCSEEIVITQLAKEHAKATIQYIIDRYSTKSVQSGFELIKQEIEKY